MYCTMLLCKEVRSGPARVPLKIGLLEACVCLVSHETGKWGMAVHGKAHKDLGGFMSNVWRCSVNFGDAWKMWFGVYNEHEGRESVGQALILYYSVVTLLKGQTDFQPFWLHFPIRFKDSLHERGYSKMFKYIWNAFSHTNDSWHLLYFLF